LAVNISDHHSSLTSCFFVSSCCCV